MIQITYPLIEVVVVIGIFVVVCSILYPMRSLCLLFIASGPVQTSSFCRAELIAIRFDCGTGKKHNSDSDVVPESKQIQDLLMPRNNSPPTSPWERNLAKHIYLIIQFMNFDWRDRSTTCESLPCQSRVALQSLSNVIACRT